LYLSEGRISTRLKTLSKENTHTLGVNILSNFIQQKTKAMINSQKKEFCYMLYDMFGAEEAKNLLFNVINELSDTNSERKSWYGIICYAEMAKYIEKELENGNMSK
jgi:hypothetical protein